jgi:hypothetical protein
MLWKIAGRHADPHGAHNGNTTECMGTRGASENNIEGHVDTSGTSRKINEESRIDSRISRGEPEEDVNICGTSWRTNVNACQASQR